MERSSERLSGASGQLSSLCNCGRQLPWETSAVRSIEYEKLAQVEHQMWWFCGLHENLVSAFHQRHPKRRHGFILDAGCGTGGFLHRVARDLPEYTLLGLDVDKTACEIAAKSGQMVCLGSANFLPFSDACLAAIFSADMLNHDGVNQRQSLQNFYRCLQPEGILVLNLPAYPWLRSSHDRAVHNVRRYNCQDVRELLMVAGFVDVKTTHWNTVLFPLMIMHRLLFSKSDDSDVRLYARPIATIFRTIMRFETFILSRGLQFPFGGSIIATAIKK
jgi:ubiquinone/menaquinone biosynthesis C-methylase UbiE